ncbi:DUF4382 domain-containing protein [Vibrio aestuarianus]|uniref:DUF4382 domain-containing protein n=1 Tax=Vibrio aestuarianus TaxID=28171 RepID=UPI00237D1CCE|nr:DUF4382 domain-containing protein [Vibrio aestuarianus]MDE1231373.1 DUF4382 domain-containing protein [Vibrio aestuarianus]
MTTNMKFFLLSAISVAVLSGCGSDSAPQQKTAKVSFSITDAPVDTAVEVNVTYKSLIFLRNGQEDIIVPLVNDEGEATTQQINLLDYQNGNSLLILNEVELPVGQYDNLIIETEGCAQNPNGSTDYCNVVDANGTYPLKTPSNKLKLGSFTVSVEATQAYTIDFNLRKSLVSTANGQSFNLKPHGITIVESKGVGSVSGKVDVNLLTAGNCPIDGNVVYLYQGNYTNELGQVLEGFVLGDEFDPAVDKSVPENVVAPYASKMVESADAGYSYSFNFLPQGDYTLAFSCSAIDDNPETYDKIVIADPIDQVKHFTLTEGENLESDFFENVD